MTPVIKSILAKKTGTINTKLESKYLNLGETALIRFASVNEFRSMLLLGHFIEYSGPSPAVIQSSQTVPDVAPKVIEAEKPKAPIVPPEMTAVESRPCKQCRTMLILTTGTDGKQVLYCANCNKEEPIEEELIKEAPEFDTKAEAEAEAPKKSVRSKCDCGKVKSKDAKLCKSCITNQAQEDGAINNG